MGLIYLCRHGQTGWNREGRFRGLADIPLNEQGRAEVAGMTEALREVRLDAIYSSPLGRAIETAKAINAGRGLEIRIETAFTSIDYGRWTGCTADECRQDDPALFALWEQHPERTRFPDGESLAHVRQRGEQRLRELAAQHAHDSIVIASHRLILKLLVLAAKGLDNSHFWDIRLDTGAFSVVECIGDDIRLLKTNETGHLPSFEGHHAMDS